MVSGKLAKSLGAVVTGTKSTWRNPSLRTSDRSGPGKYTKAYIEKLDAPSLIKVASSESKVGRLHFSKMINLRVTSPTDPSQPDATSSHLHKQVAIKSLPKRITVHGHDQLE